MSFDPDKYLEQKGVSAEEKTEMKSEFNPDTYLQKKTGTSPSEETDDKMSGPEAFFNKLTQGASFGFGDELAGGMDAAGRALGVEGLGSGSITDISLAKDGPTLDRQKLLDAYRQGRDLERAKMQKAETDQPSAALGGDIVGGLLAPIPGAGLIKGGKAAMQGTKALAKGGAEATKQAAKAGMGATKTGAVAGGLEGLGRSESEDLTGQIMDTAGGGLAGATLGKVVDKIGARNSKKALEELVEEGPKQANQTALNAMGATANDFAKELGTKTNRSATAKTARGTGQTVLDEGVLKARQTAEQLKEDLVNKLDEVYTKRMQPTIQKLDEAYAQIATEKMDQPVNNFREAFRKTLMDKIGSTRYAQSGGQKLDSDILKTSEKVYNDVVEALKSSNKFEQLNKIKRDLQNEVNWENLEISKYNEYLTGAQANISSLMNDLAGKVSPELGEQMVKNNKTYGNLINANEIAGRGLVQSQKSNNKIGLGEYVAAGVISGVTDNKLLGPATVGAKRLVEKYAGKDISKLIDTHSALRQQKAINRAKGMINQIDDSPFKRAMQGGAPTVAAAATNTASALLDETNASEPYKRDRMAADYVKKASPEELQMQANQIRKKHGKSGEQLAGTLEKISQRDKIGREALIFSLLQSPANRKMLGLIDGE